MNSEMALIAAAKRGSVLAFTELVARYRIGLLRFLVTRTASFADAEDALQDTLINAFRYIKSYDARWRFSTWLYRIAINNAASSLTGIAATVAIITVINLNSVYKSYLSKRAPTPLNSRYAVDFES